MSDPPPPQSATSTRTRVSAVAWSLAFTGLGYVATAILLTVGFQLAGARATPLFSNPVWPAILQALVGIAVFVPLTWLIGRRALHLDWKALGWVGPSVGIPGFGKGVAVAVGIGALSLVAGLPAHSAWQLDGGTVGAYLGRLAVLAVILLPAAFFEELAFRGVLLSGLVKGVGRIPGIAVAAILFAAAHRNNPEVTGLALGNIALAGIFLGATFLTRGGLWTATGAHLGWNLTLAGLGAPVSGLPFEIPWIDFHPGVPSWLTGGAFGPEGGLLATTALALGTVVVMRWRDFREGR